jgi:dienelactone hydrolase
MRRALALGGIAALTVAACAAGGGSTGPTGTWRGTWALPRTAEPAPISLELRGDRAIVALSAGHPAQTSVAVRRNGARVRFAVPGRPTPMRFDGTLRKGVVSGSVTLGAVRGSFRVRRGAAIEERTLGLYALPDGRALSVVANQVLGRAAVLLDEGEIRALAPSGAGTFAVGTGLGTHGAAGELRLTGAQVSGRFGASELAGTRVPLRQEEVRFRSGGAWLAGTLTLPPGPGPHAAVTFVHGAGAAPREFVLNWVQFLGRLGIATLAVDKRGIAQSGGVYPGEFPSEHAVDQYARDVEAAARFLAAQPEVDRARIGVSGGSQAGWIMPLAATREPAIRFMVGLVSPTVSQGETDLWADLSNQGSAPPSEPLAERVQKVRALGSSGFDPRAHIRALRIPALWLFGGNDMTVPTWFCVEELEPLVREPGRDFAYVVFPKGSHGLIETEHGLAEETLQSSRFVPGLFTTVRDWLRARGIAR